MDINWDGFCVHCGKLCYGKCGKSQEAKMKNRQVVEGDVIEYLQSKLKELEGNVTAMMVLKDVVGALRDKVSELENQVETLRRSEENRWPL